MRKTKTTEVFLFKQKTAYEILFRDWSSDVCSSDLMGSSAMGASILRKKVQEADLPQTVTNQAISQLTDDSNTLIVTDRKSVV